MTDTNPINADDRIRYLVDLAAREHFARLNAEHRRDEAREIRGHLDEQIAAWQAATGCTDPASVRVLTEGMLVEAVASVIKPRDAMGRQYAADHAADIVRSLTASGPVVLPAKPAPTDSAPILGSDEDIARDLYAATAVPGAYDDLPWSVIEPKSRAAWTAAVAKVVRPLLSRQTCPQCDAPEIHCAGCGTATSTAWECADCAAGGDAGREADRLRGAVVEAADAWAADSDPEATHYSHETTRLLRAVRALRVRRIDRTVSP